VIKTAFPASNSCIAALLSDPRLNGTDSGAERIGVGLFSDISDIIVLFAFGAKVGNPFCDFGFCVD